MFAIELSKFGKPDVLTIVERPIPVPKTGEALIKVKAAGVNRSDILQRIGYYSSVDAFSYSLGLEVSGEIVDFGLDSVETPELKIGSKICALTSGGGYAQYCVVPIKQCLPIPKNLSEIEAASLPEICFTLWSNLFDCARLASGEALLIHGGASGLGTLATQLAAEFGVIVYATAGSDSRCLAVESLGATKCINYKNQDFSREIQRITTGIGVDVVLDIVGGDYISRNLEILKPNGRLILLAFLKGAFGKVNCKKIIEDCITITGSSLRFRSASFKAKIATEIYCKVWPLFEKKIIKPIIYRIFPFHEAKLAHVMMENGENIGKILLSMPD